MLPQIPVARDAEALLEANKRLLLAAEAYERADPRSELSLLRKLIEDKRILQGECDRLARQIDSVATTNMGILIHLQLSLIHFYLDLARYQHFGNQRTWPSALPRYPLNSFSPCTQRTSFRQTQGVLFLPR